MELISQFVQYGAGADALGAVCAGRAIRLLFIGATMAIALILPDAADPVLTVLEWTTVRRLG